VLKIKPLITVFNLCHSGTTRLLLGSLSAMHHAASRAPSGLRQWNFSTGWKKQIARRDRLSFKPEETVLVAAAKRGRKKEEASDNTSEECRKEPAVLIKKRAPKAPKGSEARDVTWDVTSHVTSPNKDESSAVLQQAAAPSATPQFDASSIFTRLPGPESMWHTPRLWVCFSDLHLSTKTLAICVEVLQRVHREAVARDAGIVFLGDFWDERGRLSWPHISSS
jgi:hypothetical protein